MFAEFGIILKQSYVIALSVAFLIISFAFVNQGRGKISFVPLYIFIEEIVMEVSTTKS